MTATVGTSRWELVRALGAAIVTPPPGNRSLCAALGLPEQSAADHTAAFILGLPPFSAIYLGPEGKLGGEGLDRVAGFWRALGLQAPDDADHLGALLMLCAELGEARDTTAQQSVRSRMATARAAVFDEHIWSWAPGYLSAVSRLGVDSAAAWAQLAMHVLRYERETLPEPGLLPLALRVAPLGPATIDDFDDLLDALVTPVRSGVIVSQADLQRCAAAVGVGFRRGERRFALKAMLEQEPMGTLAWLEGFAREWAQWHLLDGLDRSRQWWAARATAFADALAIRMRELSQAR